MLGALLAINDSLIVICRVHPALGGIASRLAEVFKYRVGNSLKSLLVVVLSGIGADYIVFMLFRYREQGPGG